MAVPIKTFSLWEQVCSKYVPSTSTACWAIWPYHLLTIHDIIAHETGSFLRHYYGNRYLNSGPGNICRLSSPMTYSSSVNL